MEPENNVHDITIVEDESDNDNESESSEEFNFAVALALRKNLSETFDKHVHSLSVMDKIARLEQKTGLTKPPRQPLPLAKNPLCGIPTCPTSTTLAIYLRIRPLIASNDINTIEIEPASEPITSGPTTIRTYPPVDSNAAKVVRDSSSETGESVKGVKEFKFHQVFGPDTSQQDVYGTVAAPLVDGLFPSSSDKVVGESALLFAYGITNAGKTHTMMGDVKVQQPNQTWGIIPRAMQDILTRIEGSSQYELNLSYLEIYNEHIFDLLPSEKNCNESFPLGASIPLRIRESRDGSTFVRGLAKHRVRDVAHGLELAEKAKRKRHTSSNNLNEDSSRSHCICQLEVVVKACVHPAINVAENNNDTATVNVAGYTTDEEASQVTNYKDKTATLWIVDLAGSERSKRTGLVLGSSRQKEATLINASLMKLMRCLSVMRENQSASSSNNIIPFRESKLTHLFMNHLTGPSANRTSMIVNVNPSVGDFDETQHVLSYAAAAKSIQISQIDFHKRRRAIGGDGEPTHDNNGRALKRSNVSKESGKVSKIAKLVSKFSPKKLMSKSNVVGHDPKKRKAELMSMRGGKAVTRSSNSILSEDGGPKPKMSRMDSGRAVEKQKPTGPASYEKEMKNLKTSLSIAQAEAEVLRTEKNELEEELTQREAQIRMEIADEMEEQMKATREQYNSIIDRLKQQVQSNPTPAKSAKKAQMDKAELYIEELVDKVDECEEEMVRMREEHKAEINALMEEHARAIKEKDLLLASSNAAHEAAVRKHKDEVDKLELLLAESRSKYEKLRKSKEEMMESYERIIREEDGEDDEEEDDDDDESEEESDAEPTSRVQVMGNEPTQGTEVLPRSRCSQVACDNPVDRENIPRSTTKKNNIGQLRSNRIPFSSVINKQPDQIDPAKDDECCSSNDDSFGGDKWLRPRKPVERDELTGAYLRPRGRGPSGREWDEKKGAWRLSTVA